MQQTTNKKLQNQINAGVTGRQRGHRFETNLATSLNGMQMPYSRAMQQVGILNTGAPHIILLEKALEMLGWESVDKVEAYATGVLATAQSGQKEITINGTPIRSSKSDVILVLHKGDERAVKGVSVKQCNNNHPTNAQVFFTTATAFYNLLNTNGIKLSADALRAMQQFCGDPGFRPMDELDCTNRMSTPERYFWEEIEEKGRNEWEEAFKTHQDLITKLLMQKGYAKDPMPPEIVFHKTKKAQNAAIQETAIFSMDEFLALSKKFGGFSCDEYYVKKGRYKESKDTRHKAPRFGVIQMQRGGQKQHPTQLQFNLKAGYFYALAKL